jgi:hypothetical protein
LDGSLHDSQAPSQAALQQAPSAQNPLSHSAPPEQDAAMALRGTHAPPSQNAPANVGAHVGPLQQTARSAQQSASVVHADAHAPATQAA